jgi:hypothetical protein
VEGYGVTVEAILPGMTVRGTPAQFRRAAARLGTEEPRVCVEAIDAMADAVKIFLIAPETTLLIGGFGLRDEWHWDIERNGWFPVWWAKPVIEVDKESLRKIYP